MTALEMCNEGEFEALYELRLPQTYLTSIRKFYFYYNLDNKLELH